ncbi:MAG: PD-(D/E)XK nuclease family protein [Clostridia bacterium]|nr:PD-(D/E)XK nuclease family protein [Clostridia bacterium]
MAIGIIYGLSGSGKTRYCFDIIKKCSKNNNDVLFITPEHICLGLEKEVANNNLGGNVTVTGFSRLALTVFSKYGPILCDFIDNSTKCMIIKKLLLKYAKDLSVLRAYEEDLNFAKHLLDAINSLKASLVTPDDLRLVASNCSNMISKLKLLDIAFLYEKYNLEFKDGYFDSSDSLSLLSEKIIKFNIFKGYTVIIDGFNGFTKAQEQVIEALLKVAENIYVTCVTDTLENDNSIFFRGITVADKIYKIAYKNNVQVIPNVFLGDVSRYNNNELLYLNNNIFRYPVKQYRGKTENISLFKADDYYDEITFVASEIYRLARDFGYKYNDFAVVHRNSDVYSSLIKKIFSDYEIPVFLSENVNCTKHPLVSDILTPFEVIINNFSQNSLINWIKADFHKNKQLSWIMENYIIATGSNEKKWKNELTYQADLSDKEFLYLKENISKVTDGLYEFKNQLSGRKSFVKISEAFINLLNSFDLKKYVYEKYESIKDLQKAKQYITVYNVLIDVINNMCSIFGEQATTVEKYLEILKSGLAGIDAGQVPPSLDCVTVSEADLFKDDKKVVFVVGINEGIMPKGYINDGLISEKDKEELTKAGFDAPDTTVIKQRAESFLLYSVLSSPSEKLYLSCSSNDFDGNSLDKSRVFNNIYDIFPEITICENNATVDAVIPTFNRVITQKNKDVELWFKENMPDKYNVILTARKYTNNPDNLRGDIVSGLYGDTPYFSISKIEQYNKCPYSYFLKYGLKAKVRKENSAEIVDIGSIMHSVIDNYTKFCKEHSFETVNKTKCNEMSLELTRDTVKEFLGETFYDSMQGNTMVKKISGILKGVLWNITEFYKNSKFEMYGSEVAFGSQEGEFPEIDITLDDGTVAHFTGKIDRVDMYMTENVNYVNVVDYKTGKKDIDYAQALYGIQIQLPVYIDAICRFLTEKTKVVTVPAAILYYTIDYPIISGKRTDSEEIIKEKLRDALKMKGIVADEQVSCSALGDTFAVKPDSSRKDIEIMCKNAYKKIKSTVAEIMSGKIELTPANIHGADVCSYCDYKSVCTFESCFGNQYRIINKISKEEYIKYVSEMDK